ATRPQRSCRTMPASPDGTAAAARRRDALSRARAGRAPAPEQPLASAPTLTRFAYAPTRRGRREGEPEVLLVRRAAQVERLKVVNAFLVELFIRSRPRPPAEVVLDADATDDPVHGQQALSGYHGYYRQHQYLP